MSEPSLLSASMGILRNAPGPARSDFVSRYQVVMSGSMVSAQLIPYRRLVK
jgi:hypothetical protein